jgi:peptidyl-prolyl cis-trans isomerase A (cyclophilin A)
MAASMGYYSSVIVVPIIWVWFILDIVQTGAGGVLANSENDVSNKSSCLPGPYADVVTPDNTTIVAPDLFRVRFSLSPIDSKDRSFILEIHRAWAPVGVDRFYQLILDNYYNCAAFFRVVPGAYAECVHAPLLMPVSQSSVCFMVSIDFVVQFGIASDPIETAKWNTDILDDPGRIQSNARGTVSYATAGPGTRTTQLFINFSDNSNLDHQGFTPIGRITEGMDDVVASIYNPADGNGIWQSEYETYGNTWILQHYPNVDLIVQTTLLLDADETTQNELNDEGMMTDHTAVHVRTSPQLQAHRFYGRTHDDNN